MRLFIQAEESSALLWFCQILIALSVCTVLVAVFMDFYHFDARANTARQQRSFVATGSMFGFYLIYYLVIMLHIGTWPHLQSLAGIVSGTIMIICGAAMNIIGRLQLGSNWANQIKIYSDHRLVRHGVYALVRHPLYASLMLMMLGGSLTYVNWLSALLTIGIFIPMMNYRARQEETLLLTTFPEYAEYCLKTGRFFPRLDIKGGMPSGKL